VKREKKTREKRRKQRGKRRVEGCDMWAKAVRLFVPLWNS
jgi:hypothetical protein